MSYYFGSDRLHLPAEWAHHKACWLAWPTHEELWQENLSSAQTEFAALCRAIAPERLEILVANQSAREKANQALAGLDVAFHDGRYGDIWLRDTAPIFALQPNGRRIALRFSFNGWGQKYLLPFDDEVNIQIANVCGDESMAVPWILEGGSIEWNGEGTCLTTRQCLLNPNRNPGLTQEEAERYLRQYLGFEKVLWLDDGLVNDHTDGHIDTLARFVDSETVVCMRAASGDDPNKDTLETIYRTLKTFTTAGGKKLQVVGIPSPGSILDETGRLMPASYLNFYIANQSVVVPTYGAAHDEVAVREIGQLFPKRKVVGLSAKAILSGGGAFHCITQQQPVDQFKAD